MHTRQTVVLVVVLAVAGVVAPVIATPAPDQGDAGQSKAFESLAGENETTNGTAPLGSQISAFMESTAASADSSMEAGTWEARFNESDVNRSAMTARRTETLERRLSSLEAELEQLNASGETDVNNVSQAGRVASLTARIEALNRTIERTTTVARDAGVNTTRLERLRTNASQLHGQEVARMARNLTTLGPRGPPEDRGPPGDRGQGPPGADDNGTEQGPPTNPPNDDGTDRGTDANATDNSTDRGPPTDRPTNETDNGSQDSNTTNRTSDGDQGHDPGDAPGQESLEGHQLTTVLRAAVPL
ncbi:MAG: hypothetical protein V5A27_02265 [Halapricum sp.]